MANTSHVSDAITALLKKKKKEMNTSEIADALGMKTANVYQTLRNMVKKGTVKRIEGLHSRDVRYKEV